MTLAIVLNLATFALAIPGAIATTTDQIQKVKKKLAKKRGRVQKPAFRDTHPIWSMTLTVLMIVALIAGFWMVFHPYQNHLALAPHTPPQNSTPFPAQAAPIVPPQKLKPETHRIPIPNPAKSGNTTVEMTPGASIQQNIEGDCNTAIIGNGNVSNCDTRKKYPAMTGLQQRQLAAALSAYPGRPILVNLVSEGASIETLEFQQRLADALSHSVLDFKGKPTAYISGGLIPGITAQLGASNLDVLKAIEKELTKDGFISDPIVYHLEPDTNAEIDLFVAEPKQR